MKKSITQGFKKAIGHFRDQNEKKISRSSDKIVVSHPVQQSSGKREPFLKTYLSKVHFSLHISTFTRFCESAERLSEKMFCFINFFETIDSNKEIRISLRSSHRNFQADHDYA